LLSLAELFGVFDFVIGSISALQTLYTFVLHVYVDVFLLFRFKTL